MARRAENSNRLLPGGMDLRDVTRRAINPDGRQTAEMFHLVFSTETDRPSKCRIGNQSEISEVRSRKQIRINFNEGAQNTFGHHFGAHGAVQEKIEILRG